MRTVSKQHLLSNRRVLLVEGGKLDRVRNWKGTEQLENRVSSITAENVEFLKSEHLWPLGLTIRLADLDSTHSCFRHRRLAVYREIPIMPRQGYARKYSRSRSLSLPRIRILKIITSHLIRYGPLQAPLPLRSISPPLDPQWRT